MCLVCFSPVQGGVDSRNLYHNYIMVWVQDMQLNLLDYCKLEKVGLSSSIMQLCNHNLYLNSFSDTNFQETNSSLLEIDLMILIRKTSFRYRGLV